MYLSVKAAKMKREYFITGFTLIELMIVVVIIGILAGVVLPRLQGRAKLSKVSAAAADVTGIIPLALEMYELDTGSFPNTGQGIEALITKPSSREKSSKWSGPYLRKQPVDPWGNPYKYNAESKHGLDYDLSSTGPDGIEGTDDDIANWPAK